MKIDLSILRSIPLDQQKRFELNACEIVIESFIFTADRDYLTARFAYFQKQPHLFLWSSAQALEKYLKANVMLLGSGKTKRTHKHTLLANDLATSHPERLDFDISAPREWLDQGLGRWPALSPRKFLIRVEELGSPNLRYDQSRVEIHLQDLIFLDRLVFRLRDSLILESVECCKYVGDEIKKSFLDLNYSFAPADYLHPQLSGLTIFQDQVTTLDAAQNGCFGYGAQYRKWACNSMGLKEGS